MWSALVGAYPVTVSDNKSMLKERTIPSRRLIAGFLCRLYGSHLLRDAIFLVDELEYSTIVNQQITKAPGHWSKPLPQCSS
jgi:hypothetical protein